ncbi:DUF1850 domain-containing protein [Metabacillus iocasae]|uniref:DUF1850 domain-containing protein n=1 Tax=Priestia iocasae TaxID=2291674 RepID=A0ABS2R1X7_9BACI|nr:DUF1850 domain-containing protein [Metabacillus iocasae]MBM7704749.1 hypothetical protein [Metabacillus iocasae]
MKKKLVLIVVAVMSLAICFVPFKEALVIEHENSNKVIGYAFMEGQTSFQIKYTHSIHLSDVIETYEITNQNELKQTELQYEDFAIGMPSDSTEGATFVEEDGRYYLKDMNRVFPFIDLRIGQVVANHTLLYENRKIPFSSFVQKGNWIRIDYKHVSLWDIVKGVNVLG